MNFGQMTLLQEFATNKTDFRKTTDSDRAWWKLKSFIQRERLPAPAFMNFEESGVDPETRIIATNRI